MILLRHKVHQNGICVILQFTRVVCLVSRRVSLRITWVHKLKVSIEAIV